ncbi:sporulation membrane protein YtrI [Evansella cellulosilytica]|uniref:Sporulation membrane protein YtrI C-terminal domain-containing protein n=1 Tax=Evansella cellulosilytica (strain ATCC 21833 / DSM 2522 / FERM P-1141 / JCM 9156 / N-4) TaxID=649639 RepID=E6U128_EVAC2|nr:sporulation membrane protein YtrI [Evansella cellulosilytica]ADU31474.1 hypothetical protein Bcell_3232 [Evansella cellulosilytica DSM 2522]
MRIPPLYHDKSWQRFFAGVILGMIIGWFFFIHNFGSIHENLVLEINKQKTTIENQEDTIENLRKEQDERNNDIKQSLTIQDVSIKFVNEEDIKISELTLHQLRSEVEKELERVRNKDIETVAGSKELLLGMVENKQFVTPSQSYQLIVEQLVLYTTLEMNLRIEKVD